MTDSFLFYPVYQISQRVSWDEDGQKTIGKISDILVGMGQDNIPLGRGVRGVHAVSRPRFFYDVVVNGDFWEVPEEDLVLDPGDIIIS